MAETPPEFFIDRSLGRKHLATALTEQGVIVHTMASVYGETTAQGLADEQWLTDAGTKGWIVLMKDDAIRRRPAERDALADAAVPCLPCGWLGVPALAGATLTVAVILIGPLSCPSATAAKPPAASAEPSATKPFFHANIGQRRYAVSACVANASKSDSHAIFSTIFVEIR